jgi:putative two-component system response regulator
VNEKEALILVVDDEDRNLRLMEAMLTHMGCMVVVAHNGQDALAKVEEISPDVILLDIMMPEMDGIEVARRLKQNEHSKIIPIVMVTALSGLEDRVRALDAGADDFLAKPVEIVELRARIRSLIKVKAYNDHMRDHQKKLEAEIEKRTQQLHIAFERIKLASLDTVYKLSRAAEYRDEDTGAHIQRMSHYAAAVARRMGLAERVVENILYASPMHDVGKIGIPDHILLKPMKLDSGEWEIMKQHTLIGARILEDAQAGFLELARVIALTHHERWDGTGYPRGLKGSKIPLAGRIAAISDVFDALTSKRPYKEPYSLEKSLSIIKEGKGGHFDPDVVDAFFDIQNEILFIKDKYRDQEVSLLVRMAGGSSTLPGDCRMKT